MQFLQYEVDKLTETNPYKLIEQIYIHCNDVDYSLSDTSYIELIKHLKENNLLEYFKHGHVACLLSISTSVHHSQIENLICKIHNQFQGMSDCSIYTYDNYPTIDILIISSLYNLYSLSIKDRKHPLRYAVLERMKSCLEYHNKVIADELYEFDIEYELHIDKPYTIQLIHDVSDIEDVQSKFNVDDIYNKLTNVTISAVANQYIASILKPNLTTTEQSIDKYAEQHKLIGDQMSFIVPSDFYHEDSWSLSFRKQFIKHCKHSEKLYRSLLKTNKRSNSLHNAFNACTATQLYLTGNLDDWNKFIDTYYLQLYGRVDTDMYIIAEQIHSLL